MKPIARDDLSRALKSLDHPVERVLVVDDDPDAVELFSQMLHVCDSSLDVATAHGGKEALDRLRSAPPDLLLLDLVMPEVDGWQVLETIARDESIPNVPTFLVSAQDLSDQPPRTGFLLATMENGFSLNQFLRCSLELSNLLLQPEGTLDPTLG
jgi:CheY-like chemotaxis protein